MIEGGDSLLVAEHFHGPLSLFLDAGFGATAKTSLTVVRKLLASPA